MFESNSESSNSLRVNSTLKGKSESVDGKDWNKLILYLLYAYSHASQAYTGFSPFVEKKHSRSSQYYSCVLRELLKQ